jgi:hypothetical protein
VFSNLFEFDLLSPWSGLGLLHFHQTTAMLTWPSAFEYLRAWATIQKGPRGESLSSSQAREVESSQHRHASETQSAKAFTETSAQITVDARSNGAFQYARISKEHIRLLLLAPGKDEEPVHCMLMVSSFPNIILDSYSALSYTWGTRENPATIFVNQQPLEVTQNLEKALRCVRDDDGVKVFWVDAICINQEDSVEKADQIKNMRFIYERAQIVEVWLGDHLDDHSNVAVRAALLFRVGKSEARRMIAEPGMAWFLEDFSQLIERPYWKRVWIVQELVCARRILLHYGPIGILWDPIEMINTWLIQWQNEYASAHTRNFTKLPLIGSPYIQKISSHRELHQFHQDAARKENLDLRRGTFMNLLGEKQPTFASEPKDHIYGLLGIVEDLSKAPTIPIDYSLTTEEVFINATKHILVNDKNLCIFSRIQSEELEQPILALPSWCPDYARSGDRTNSFWQFCRTVDNMPYASAP